MGWTISTAISKDSRKGNDMEERREEKSIVREKEYYEKKMEECAIPRYMWDGIIYYLTEGLAPGHFLTAVISNDLYEAVSRADNTNIHLLDRYITFFYNYTPTGCWGSPSNFDDWIAYHRQRRRKAGQEAG